MPNRRRLALLLAAALALAGLGAAFSRLAPARPAHQGQAPASATTPPPAAPAGQAAAAPAPAAKGDLASRLAAMEQVFERRREELGIPGLSLAVVRGDEVIYLKGLGKRDLARDLPVTPDTLFRIGSSTKSFTALLAVMAWDEGKLSLDDPPRKYLPYFKMSDPAADAAVTLRDLLSHRTGLLDNDSLWYGSGLDREQMIRAQLAARPVAPVGKEFHYNNIMYAAAGEAVARALGAPWERLIAERILGPLGMDGSSTSIFKMEKAADAALGYTPGRPNQRMPNVDVSACAPAGAINSSARDMAKWLRLMVSGGTYGGRRLVSERGFAELLKKEIPTGKKGSYCMGWMAHEWRGREMWSHGGAIDGYSGMVALLPDRKLGFVMLTNVAQSELLFESPGIVWEHLAEP